MPWRRFDRISPRISDMCKSSDKTIILIGFMGAGKSTLGRALARMTGMPLVDLDALIVEQQRRPIPDIFAAEGEAAFRRYETDALRSLPADLSIIIATGGGIVGCEQNWQLMREMGTIIYLRAQWDSLRSRLSGSTGRPLATADRSEADIKCLWQQRVPLYEQADFIVDTDGRGVDEVAQEIMSGVFDRWRAC
ncbi:MAG: shikimate kinase [Syntrophotaleaceae bacterium]